MTGQAYDTYVAALQHDLADLPEGTVKLGVVRKPTPWFYGAVDDNVPELGPPVALLEAFDDHQEGLAERGMCEEGAHNAAWEELDFEQRYRSHLENDAPQSAVEDVLDRIREGADVALVCYENTERKRCHRTILREELESRL